MELTISEPQDQFEPGVYEARFNGLEPGDDYGNGPTLRWTFFVLDPEPDDDDSPWVEQTYMTSAVTGPRSKAHKVISAILGRPPVAGEQVSFGELIGTPVRLSLIVNDNGWNRLDAAYPSKAGPVNPAKNMKERIEETQAAKPKKAVPEPPAQRNLENVPW